jgi:hypothetical protein
MRKLQSIALVTSLGFSLAVTPSAHAKQKPKPKPKVSGTASYPSAPTVVSVSSFWGRGVTIDVTVEISLPTSHGSSIITNSYASAGSKSCDMKKMQTKCTIRGLKIGKPIFIFTQSGNEEGYGEKSEVYVFETPSARQGKVITSARSNLRNYSRIGLISQLQKKKFSLEEATNGVDSLLINWPKQAEKAARNHLVKKKYSRSDLISLLVKEGFSIEDATYGATNNGL